MAQLGRLEQVELREAWPTEASHFTPWLAKPENIEILGTLLGVELEVVEEESRVGPFRADILCLDTATSDHVLIENQIERTDHTHLGQLLTYSSGLSAVTIVWIAKQFTDEHRAALDWLNSKTEVNISFFGLEVELWRIGNSEPAPKFNIVSKPNNWSRAVARASSGTSSLTENGRLQIEYWAQFAETARSRPYPLTVSKGGPYNWVSAAVGRSDFYLWASTNAVKSSIQAGLTIAGSHAVERHAELFEMKDEISSNFDGVLEWSETDSELKQRYIAVPAITADPKDRSDWPRQHEWLVANLEGMHKALSAKIKALN
jgi:hypothetical protein